MGYQVADNAEPHRSTSPNGAELFIVDGGEADWPLPSLLDVAKHGADHSLLVNSELRAWRMR